MSHKTFLFVIVSLLLFSCLPPASNIRYTNAEAKVQSPESWKIYAVAHDIVLLQGYLQVNEEVISTLFRSENSGKDWVEVYTPPKPSKIPFSSNLISCGGNYEFSFLDNGAGWLVSTWGVSGEGQYKLTVDSTNDFGKSWSRLSEVDVIPSYEFLGMSFIDEMHGQIDLLYFNTTKDRIAFLTTMDGGVTWQETGSLLLNQAFWNGNKLEYFDTIEKYVEYNFPKTPHETSYNDRHWKIESPQGTSEIVVFKKSQSGEWVKVGSFQ